MRFHGDISLEELKKTMKNFIGKIMQKPPVKSRVKRQERQREVKSFEILEKNGQDILFKTAVEGGTYIRKLVHDLGENLGVGAHMLELRRIRAGIFREDDEKYPSISLYELERAIKKGKRLREIIIPGEIISKIYPIVQIKRECVDRILHGQPIYQKDLVKEVKIEKDNIISIFSMDKFIGMFRVVLENEIFAKPEFVLQPIGK